MTYSAKKHSEQIQGILELILKIPGVKILRLMCGEKSFEFDVTGKGYFGRGEKAKALFISKLAYSLENSGILVVREFLTVKTKKMLSSGKEIWIPEKNLYGIFLQEGSWFGLSAEALQECYRTDAKSGEVLPIEKGVHYRSLEMHGLSEVTF